MKIIAILAVTWSLFMCGCNSGKQYMNFQLLYRNTTGREIDILSVKEGTHNFLSPGCVINGSHAGMMSNHYLPEYLTIIWEDEQEKKHEASIDIKDKVPSNFDLSGDTIVINFNKDNSLTISFKIEVGKYQRIEYDVNGKELNRFGVWKSDNQTK